MTIKNLVIRGAAIAIIGFAAITAIFILSGASEAHATPAICNGHVDYDSAANGMHKGDKYVTACGGDSGPDAGGNNATAPRVSTKAS